MDIVNPEVEAYAETATSAWPAALSALDAATRETLGHGAMLSGPVVGRLLETLVFISRPRLVLEIGTFSGASALWMARALGPDARLITCEIDAEHAAFARRHLAGDPRIELREGPALETIAGLAGPFDLVFVDADKPGYPAYIEAVLPKLSDHGLIVCDNMLRGGEVLDPPDTAARVIDELNRRAARDPALVSVMLTVRDGLTLIRRAA